MEFSFDLSELFHDEITCVDSSLQPCRQNGGDRHKFRELQHKLFEVVDKMGDASAKAQNLRSSITSGRKLELTGQRLYIMMDNMNSRGKGSIVGILKVGTKKLFVYDSSKVQHELQPLCVLDFYIHESRQRMGHGHRLFDFMLQKERVAVQHMAIDRPSPKLLSFLAKHYQLQVLIPQVNNFVIFQGFFHNRTDVSNGRRNWLPGDSLGEGYGRRNGPPGENFGEGSGMSSRGLGSGSGGSSHLQRSDSDLAKNTLQNWLTPQASNFQRNNIGLASSDRPQQIFTQGAAGDDQSQLTNRTPTHTQLPQISANQKLVHRHSPIVPSGGFYRPFSGKQSCYSNKRGYSEFSPPHSQQDGVSPSYKDILNMHQMYQQRNGHLTVPARNLPEPDRASPKQASYNNRNKPHTTTATSLIQQPQQASYNNRNKPSLDVSHSPHSNTSWTVTGVLRDQNINAMTASSYISNHRFW